MTSSGETPLFARSNREFCVLATTATVEQARAEAAGRLVVLIGSDAAPIGVAHPDLLAGADPQLRLADFIHTLPATVIVDAGIGQADALGSWAFSQVDRHSSVVFTQAGEVVGVWSGPELAVVIARARWRVNQDMHLPGESSIPLLASACQFRHEGVPCSTVLTFEEFPEQPFRCPNLANLPIHDFEWKSRS
jgi:hypothetical protein